MSTKHTPGPWEMWTSNSFRRISSKATCRDGDVLHAVVQRSDGHPDLHFPNGGFNGPDARLMLAAPELLAELRSARDYIKRHCDELRDSHSIPGTGKLDPADVLDDDLAHLARIDALISKATGGAA